jgi:hypothetical protein
VEAIMMFNLNERLALDKYKPPYNRTLNSSAIMEQGKINRMNGKLKEDFLERINIIDPEFDE